MTSTIHFDATRTFRAASQFDLLLFDALTSEERQRLGALQHEEDLWGVARSKDGATLHVLGCETALLLLSLKKPGPLPGFAKSEVNRQAVLALVLDGLLEVRCGEGFASSADALETLAAPKSVSGAAASEAGGFLGELSLRALRYGARLGFDDALALGGCLYGYNRLPRSPRWERRLPDGTAVEAFLGLGEGSALQALVDRTWRRSGTREAWLSWHLRRPLERLGHLDRQQNPSYKLYLSPRPESLPQAFSTLVETLPQTRAFSFKTGSDAWGILRPDKLVMYFTSFEDLEECADFLSSRLRGLPVQGAPFTAPITSDGLLSWGMDPPRSDRFLPGDDDGKSWRRWVVDRLASALIAGQGSWRLALERLRLAGVDVESWTPSLTLFNPTSAEN